MRTGFGPGAFALVALILWCSAATAQRVERPVFYVGDTWTYTRTDAPLTYLTFRAYSATQVRTVTKMFPDEFEVTIESVSDSGSKAVSTEMSSLDFNDFVQLSAEQPRTEIKAWKFPVEVGDVWKYEVPVKTGVQIWEVRAIAWEDVEVPAGKFKALKVEREMISDPGGGRRRTTTIWFAPEAKVNVKRVDRGNNRVYTGIDASRELVSYKVK